MKLSLAELSKIISDSSDPRNIFRGGDSGWNHFISTIHRSIGNVSLNRLPLAKLNADGSVSFLIHKYSEEGCLHCKSAGAFEENFNESYIVDQLDHHRKRLEFPLIADRTSLVENLGYSEVTDIVEYRVNISPEHLDSLLKLSPYYSYRGESSVLKLRNSITLKPGVICLFPVAPLDTKFSMRVAGFQTCEIPCVQLLHLLPDFDGIEQHFHWIPDEVETQLSLEREDIAEILTALLSTYKMLGEDDRISFQSLEGSHLISKPAEELPDGIKIVDMTPEAQNIYLLYGNVGLEELEHCKSVEISTVAFLNTLKKRTLDAHERLAKSDSPHDKYYRDHPEVLEEMLASIPTIDKIINNETERLAIFAASGGAGVSAAASGGAGTSASAGGRSDEGESASSTPFKPS